MITVQGPLNVPQVAQAFVDTPGMVGAHDDGTFWLDFPSMTDAQITARLATVVYDANWQPPDQVTATTIRQRATAALTANQTYLALSPPTQQQVVAQVAALTKECNALIRLMLNRLDSTAGT